MLCAAMSGLVALAVVLKGHVIGSTLSGLVLLYTIDVSDYLTFLTRMHAECQMSMNSVERIIEYCEVEEEQYYPKKRSQAMGSEVDQQQHGGSGGGSPRLFGGSSSSSSCPRDAGDSRGRSRSRSSSSDAGSSISGGSPRESSFYGDSAATLKGWPAVGSIEFVNISMKYRPTSPPVLK